MDNKIYRNHPLIIITNISGIVNSFMILFLFKVPNAIKTILNEGLTISEILKNSMLLIVLLILLLLIAGFLNWRKYLKQSFELTDSSFIFIDDRLNKKAITLPRSDISNVSTSQTILERLFNLYRLTIDTNTKATAKTSDIILVQKKEIIDILALTLKSQVTVAQDGDTTLSEDPQPDKDKVLFHVKSRKSDVWLHTIMTVSWLSLLISFVFLCWGIISIVLIFYLNTKNIPTPFADGDLNSKWTILLALSGLILPIISPVTKTFISSYGFELRRLNDRLELCYGLFTRRHVTIPVQRINALIIEQTFIERILGYANIKVINIGYGNDEKETSQILLTSPLSKLQPILESILPEYSWFPRLIPQEKNAFFSQAFWPTLNTTIIVSGMLYFLPGVWKWLILPIIFLLPLYVYFSFITPKLSYDERRIAIRSGIFDATIAILFYDKIEMFHIKQPLLTRPFNLSYAKFYILSGEILSGFYLTGFFKKNTWNRISNYILNLK